MDFEKVTSQNNFPMIFWVPHLSMSTLLIVSYFFFKMTSYLIYCGGRKMYISSMGYNY